MERTRPVSVLVQVSVRSSRVASRAREWTGKGKHSIERDLRPMLGIRIDIDLVDDVAGRQTFQCPHQMG